MAKTPSQMTPLDTVAPDFTLPNLDGQEISLYKEVGQNPFLVLFICNHCPYVIHVMPGLLKISEKLLAKGFKIFAINSNDVSHYPEDSPSKMKEFSDQWQMPFPYLFDESQNTAKQYRAACTPDLFLFNGSKKLFYRGQLDESRPGNAQPNDSHNLREAADAILQKALPPTDQKPSMGCNIKWKKGLEPNYW